jgi:hypothetical protein
MLVLALPALMKNDRIMMISWFGLRRVYFAIISRGPDQLHQNEEEKSKSGSG